MARASRLGPWLADVVAVLGLLTRLPVPSIDPAGTHGANAAWAWPLAGLVVGGLGALVASLAFLAGLPAPVAALAFVATQVAATGALHEDGLADSLDGLWGGWDRTRRLEIMSDSRIGAYGVVGLVLTLGLRWQLWALAIGAGALWPAALALGLASRAPMAVLSAALPFARPDGLSRSVGRPSPRAAAGAGLIGALGLIPLGWAAPVVLAGICAVAWAWARIARARIGGQTGDILGAVQQLSEIAGLLALGVVIS